jgi:chromosome segregation ATPase
MSKEDRGPNDLEEQIDMLTKQKEYMQKKCREAGAAILDLEFKVQTLKKDLDRVSEERDNFLTILGDGKDDTR